MKSPIGQFTCKQTLGKVKEKLHFQVSLNSREGKFQDRFVNGDDSSAGRLGILAVSLTGQSTNQKILQSQTEIIGSKIQLRQVFNFSVSAF